MTSKDLWEQETENIEPLARSRGTVRAKYVNKNFKRSPVVPHAVSCAPSKTEQYQFDSSLYKKIASDKIKLDVKIDLHGFSENLAFSLLEELIKKFYSQERRRVLVITGKGRDGGGRIKAMLPQWLSSPRLLPFVSSFAPSSPRHGGQGAWYVLLRRFVSK